MLFYIQKEITEVWKNNILENLVEKEQKFEIIERLLMLMKIEFRQIGKKVIKIGKLQFLKQERKIVEELLEM